MGQVKRARTRGRLSLVVGVVAAAVMFSAVAYADQIVNNIDSTIDADFEAVAVNHGGSATVGIYLNPTTGTPDTQNGCNLNGSNESESVTFSVSSSDTSVAAISSLSTTLTGGPNRTTISGNQFTVRQCSNPEGTPVVVSVNVAAQGSGTVVRSANITFAVVSDDAAGTFITETARFRVNVGAAPVTNTAPTVQVTGVEMSESYPKGSVPAPGCLVSDAEDGHGNSTTAATPQVDSVTGPYASDGIGQQTVTCSYTDSGGLQTTASATYGIVDPSAPLLGSTLTPATPDGANGWYKSNVSLTWSVSDAQSPNSLQKTGCVDQSITVDQAAQTYSCSATSAGGSADPVSVVIKRDATAPIVECGSDSGAWHATNVNIGCSASDATSGLANSGDASFNLGTNVPEGSETAAASTGSRDVFDVAGNMSAAAAMSGIKVDRKAPTHNCDAVPAAWSKVDVSIDCVAQDGGSGLANAADANFTLTATLAAGDESSNIATDSKSLPDAVGNTATAGPLSGVKIDKKAPEVSCDPAPTGWSAVDISISCTASDGGSGLTNTSPANFSLTTSVSSDSETINASTDHRTIEDNVGHQTPAGPIGGLKVDKKAPVVSRNTAADSCTVPGTNGWCRGTATVGFTAIDGGSGLATDGAAARNFTRSSSTDGSSAAIGSDAVADMVGNTNGGITETVKIDSTSPVVSCPTSEPVFMARQLPATITGTITDATSGAAGPVTATASNPNGGAVTLIGYDNAGNSASIQCAYHVGSFTFEQPINLNALNIAKLGRVVPVKGTAKYDGVAITSGGSLYIGTASKVNCTTGVAPDDVEVYAAAGSSNTGNLFRWDVTGAKWIYNYDTSVLDGGNCYRFNIYYGGTVANGLASGGVLIDYFLMKVVK